MRNTSLLWSLLLVCLLVVTACKSGNGGNKPVSGKWLPYPEQMALKEQRLRSSLKVTKREAMSNAPSDSGEVWFPSEITLYNSYGQPTLVQLMDASGAVTKETKYEYKDSLLVREDIQEASGYTSSMHYTYNEKGQKVGELLFQRGDSVLRRDYKLDADGNEVEVNLLKFRDGAKLQLKTGRDALGRPTKVQEIQNNKANWTEVYTLTDSVWRIQRTDAQGQLQSDYEMRFDANKAITHMVNRSPEGKARLTIDYTNDDQGRALTEQYFGAQGQPMQSSEFKYNEKGLLAERILISPTVAQRTVTRYSYSFGEKK